MARGKQVARPKAVRASIALKLKPEEVEFINLAAAEAGESPTEFMIGSAMVRGSSVMRALEAFLVGGPLTHEHIEVLSNLKDLRAGAIQLHRQWASLTIDLAAGKARAHRKHRQAEAEKGMAAA